MNYSKDAQRYATSRVGERGERHMPNEYEYDALAQAFDAGAPKWIMAADHLPPYGTEVLAMMQMHYDTIRPYLITWKELDDRLVAWMPVPAFKNTNA